MKKKIQLLYNNYSLENHVANNLKNVTYRTLLLPLFVIFLISLFLIVYGGYTVDSYAKIQKNLFLYINNGLSKHPNLQFNITQLGDVIIFLPFFSFLIICAPTFWRTLLNSLMLSSVSSFILKKIFSMPRPAAIFDNESFVIVGRGLFGNTSLPSGHSIATFTIITVFLLAFKPKPIKARILWFVFFLSSGIFIVFTRVGVGAHYPIDVMVGSAIGSIAAIFGVFLNRKISLWKDLRNINFYPIYLLIILLWAAFLIKKIITANLLIFYFSLFSLLITFYLIATIYAKK